MKIPRGHGPQKDFESCLLNAFYVFIAQPKNKFQDIIDIISPHRIKPFFDMISILVKPI